MTTGPNVTIGLSRRIDKALMTQAHRAYCFAPRTCRQEKSRNDLTHSKNAFTIYKATTVELSSNGWQGW